FRSSPNTCFFWLNPYLYFPICGTDGKTYGNKCFFCGAVYENLGSLCFAHYGECESHEEAKQKGDL
uniref:Kazal-like domain-containing protein n=1 Tax=Chelonoidis abingdonii TaxID=106734 RepID=A0A8C0GM92_CHEAB